jgi:hypothetical protein
LFGKYYVCGNKRSKMYHCRTWLTQTFSVLNISLVINNGFHLCIHIFNGSIRQYLTGLALLFVHFDDWHTLLTVGVESFSNDILYSIFRKERQIHVRPRHTHTRSINRCHNKINNVLTYKRIITPSRSLPPFQKSTRQNIIRTFKA